MVPLVEIPELVQHYAPFFSEVFSPAALEQFQRYLSGLVVSENKTVDGINRIFVVDTRNQSSLNRLLTESPFSLESLNQARLALLESLPGTQVKRDGVISIDDTLLTHYGHHFDQIAKLFDPVSRSYVWAHNLVNLHYSDDTTDYPLAFQLWEPAAAETLEAGLKAAGVHLRAGKYALKQTDPVKWRAYLVGVWTRHQQNPEVQKVYQSKLLPDIFASVDSASPDNLLLVYRCFDRVTGNAAQPKAVVCGVLISSGECQAIRDWQVMQILNELEPPARLSSSAEPEPQTRLVGDGKILERAEEVMREAFPLLDIPYRQPDLELLWIISGAPQKPDSLAPKK